MAERKKLTIFRGHSGRYRWELVGGQFGIENGAFILESPYPAADSNEEATALRVKLKAFSGMDREVFDNLEVVEDGQTETGTAPVNLSEGRYLEGKTLTGWGVVRSAPWDLHFPFPTREAAEAKRSELGDGYVVKWGDNREGSDDFMFDGSDPRNK